MLTRLARYAPLRDVLIDPDGGTAGSLLDVGSGHTGFACLGTEAPFVGLDLLFTGPVAPSMSAVRTRPGPLPFADAAFGTVVSVDVLEHVAPADRGAFVAELARCAARRVVIACPSDEAAHIDDLLRDILVPRGEVASLAPDEHGQHGLPSEREIAALCRAPAGFRARPLEACAGFLAMMAAVAEAVPELVPHAARAVEDGPELWRDLFARAEGPSYRKCWLLERERPLVAAVHRGNLAGTLPAAMRCPACGAPFRCPRDGGVRCTGCARRVRRMATGAWDLAALHEAPPRRAAPARPALRLAPDWGRPETWLPALSAFVARAPVGRAPTLHVEAGEVPLDLAAGLLTEACAWASAGHPFAEVVLTDDASAMPPAAIAVNGAAALRDVLGLPVGPPATDAADAVARALEAKRLSDRLEAAVDRWRFDTAPDPFADPDPLVSVRIPTWRGAELLIARAIPSVLGGSHRNVEVVVCGDGPDPEARRAVAALGDPRVRYVELPERPAYASHFQSFWMSAGSMAANGALAECRGAFIAPLDHDDAFTDDHIAELLAAARATEADLVYGQAVCEFRGAPWRVIGSAPLELGRIAHGAVLHSRRLAHLRFDRHCWLLDEPGDWNLWRRMAETGATVVHVPRVVLVHHREKSSIEHRAEVGERELEGAVSPPLEALAHDLVTTPARWLLETERQTSAPVVAVGATR